MLAGVDETEGVDGGVMPLKPREPFGELLFRPDIGDGMLYLCRRNKRNEIRNAMNENDDGKYENLPSVLQRYTFRIH